MAINFPDTPQVGETHTESGRQWEWNGTSWRIIGNASNYTLPIASDVTLGGIKVGSNLTINALTGVLDAPPPSGYTLPVATTTQLGGVKIDGNTIIIDGNGVISGQAAYTLPVATTNVLGGVKIDGTSITINNGVISAAATGGANVTTDDTPPTIASDGDLWWDSVAGNLKVYYEDVDSSQWVDASANGGGSTSTFSGSYNDLTDKPTIHTYSLAALLSPGVELQVDGAGVPANRIFFDGGSGVSVVRTNTNPHTIEFKSSFAATLDSKTTSYTLLASDVGKTIKMTSPGGGVNLSLYIPNTFTPALSFGDQFTIMNGANESIAVDVVDDTVNTLYWSQSGFGAATGGYSTGDRQIAGFAFPITLTYRGNNEWNIHGDGVF